MSKDDERALVRRGRDEVAVKPGTGLAPRPTPGPRGAPPPSPPPRGPAAAPGWSRPKTAADRGPNEFVGFEDFMDFGEEPLAGNLGDDGAFGGSSVPDERAAAQSGTKPGFDLMRWRIRDAVLNLVTRDLVERHQAIPIAVEDEELVVAIADPANSRALEEIAAHAGMTVRAVRAPREAIWARILEHYRA